MVFKEWDNHNFHICHSNKFCLSKNLKTKPSQKEQTTKEKKQDCQNARSQKS